MKNLIEYEVGSETVYIEIEDQEEQGTVIRAAATTDRVIIKAKDRFNEAVKAIRPAAEVLLDGLREMNTPSEIGLDFGIKFTAKAGAVFTSIDGEATFKVSLKWINSK